MLLVVGNTSLSLVTTGTAPEKPAMLTHLWVRTDNRLRQRLKASRSVERPWMHVMRPKWRRGKYWKRTSLQRNTCQRTEGSPRWRSSADGSDRIRLGRACTYNGSSCCSRTRSSLCRTGSPEQRTCSLSPHILCVWLHNTSTVTSSLNSMCELRMLNILYYLHSSPIPF